HPQLSPLSLHDALPISRSPISWHSSAPPTSSCRCLATADYSRSRVSCVQCPFAPHPACSISLRPTPRSGSPHGSALACRVSSSRSEEHTSELQSRFDLV